MKAFLWKGFLLFFGLWCKCDENEKIESNIYVFAALFRLINDSITE